MNLAVKECCTVLILTHSHIIAHVVVVHDIIHIAVLSRRSVNTRMGILPLLKGGGRSEKLAHLVNIFGDLSLASDTTLVSGTNNRSL